MTLNEFLAQTKGEIFQDIKAGGSLRLGEYDEARLADLRSKGEPQIGTAVLQPRMVSFEFLFRMPDGQTQVFSVDVEPKERIVFMPVPEWVIESVWQGEVLGSHHFESDATQLVSKYQSLLEERENALHFDEQKTIGRK